ncbi:MAG: hypothetical protein QG549_185 [Patescibacteria group bacterium]|nr:hypothetical protein [Patescibacteria group bacterium]
MHFCINSPVVLCGKKIPRFIQNRGWWLVLADVAHGCADCACERNLCTGLVFGVDAGGYDVVHRKTTNSDRVRRRVITGVRDSRADLCQFNVGTALFDSDGIVAMPYSRKRIAVDVVLFAVDLCRNASNNQSVQCTTTGQRGAGHECCDGCRQDSAHVAPIWEGAVGYYK